MTESTEDGTDKRAISAISEQPGSRHQSRLIVDQLVATLHQQSTRRSLQLLRDSSTVDEALRAAELASRETVSQKIALDSAIEPVIGFRPVDSSVPGSGQDVMRASSAVVDSILRAVETWRPVLEMLSAGIQQWTRSAHVWRSRVVAVTEVVFELQQQMLRISAPARLVIEGIQGQLEQVHRLVQSPQFKAWVDELTSEEFQDGLRRVMDQAEEAERVEVVVRPDVSGAIELKEAQLLQWFVALIRQMNAFGLPPSRRMTLYAFVVPLLLTIYFEQGNDQDHAEMLAVMERQHQMEISQGLEAGQTSAELVELIQALLTLQQIEQSYVVIVDGAPVRDVLSGPVSRRLEKEDEVQVLAAAGKWRRVQSVDVDGQAFTGWMLNKHLQRMKEGP